MVLLPDGESYRESSSTVGGSGMELDLLLSHPVVHRWSDQIKRFRWIVINYKNHFEIRLNNVFESSL